MKRFNLSRQCLWLLLVLLPLIGKSQELKSGDLKSLTAETWTLLQENDHVQISGQLGTCEGKEIVRLKIQNQNDKQLGLQLSFLNGTKRFGLAPIILQPHSEVLSDCNAGAFPPVLLPDGHSIKVESILTQNN